MPNNIRWVPDLVAPAAVGAIDLVTKASMPNYHEYIIYALTALGYVGGFMGFGGDFVKNIGVASLPLTMDKIYNRVRGGTTRLALRRVAAGVSRYPAQPVNPAFVGGARLV